jgi:streptogramin lyase
MRRSRSLRITLLASVVSLLAAIAPASATSFPEHLPLPDGFQPEGIVIGEGTTFYVGSIPTGDLWRGDLETGDGERLEVPDGRVAVGLGIDDRNRVFVAGGPTGHAYVYDGDTGESLADYMLTEGSTFINDVEVTADAAWFTDSFNPFVYKVPIAADGTLGAQEDVVALEITGDFEQVEGFNMNGIEATPDGDTLIVVQSATGKLFTIDPGSGVADEIELSGGDAASGDGLLLRGRLLFVVQNFLNQVAVVRLGRGLGTGEVFRHLHDSDMDIPTTIDALGSKLYVVNARFGVEDPENASYTVEQIPTR